MADDRLSPSGEQPQTGGHPLDQAAGATAYMESAADGGEIDLGGLLPSVGEGQLAPPPAPGGPGAGVQPSAPNPAPAAAAAEPVASDFPQDVLNGGPGAGPAAAADAEASKNGHGSRQSGRLTAVFTATKAGWHWLWGKIAAIPPLDDIFDWILFSLGLQRKPSGMLKRAGSLARKGRLVEAIRWYRDLLALRPLSVAAYDGLGRAYFRMGLTEEANREFTIAENLERILHNRDDIDSAASLAQAFLERKQPKVSISLIEPVLIAHFFSPGNRDLLKTMGRVYNELRANKKVHQVYSAGLAQYPDDHEFHILKGEAEIRLGNVAEGERLVRWGRLMRRLKEAPGDANAKMAIGELYLKEQKIEEGLAALRGAAALSPENTGIRWRLFNLYQKQGQYAESLKYLLEIVDLEPDSEDLQYRLADFYRRNKHGEEALAIYRTLINRHPREPRPHLLMGDLLMEMGNFEEGQRMKDLGQTLECGLKADPDHSETVQFMQYLFSIGQTAEAREWLERGLAKWPYHGELVLTKARLLYNEYRYKDAMALLKRLISVKPNVAEPHIWIAMCHQRMGDNMAALAEAQLSTRLAPRSYTAHKVLGDILKEQRKLSQANAAYEVAEMMRQGKK